MYIYIYICIYTYTYMHTHTPIYLVTQVNGLFCFYLHMAHPPRNQPRGRHTETEKSGLSCMALHVEYAEQK